jgi:cell division protein FtsL
MMRGTSIAIVVLIGLIGIGLFHLTHEVRELEQELARLNHDILAEQEATHVLKAEWSYLTRPDRLEELNERHLHLGDMDGARVLRISDLPFRPLLDSGPEAGGDTAMPEAVPLPPLPDPGRKPKEHQAQAPAPAGSPIMASAEVTQ